MGGFNYLYFRYFLFYTQLQEHTLLQLQFALQEQALPLQLHWAVHPKALVVVPFDLQATVLQQ